MLQGRKESGSVFADRYEILNLLGAGGMGEVYLAKDRFLDGALIAVKILHPKLCRNPEFVQRFLREVKAMRLVSHPNVVRSFEAGDFGGELYYTMECLKGTPLSELVQGHDAQNPVPWDLAEKVLRQICRGLRAIHNAKLVHRDLKPENIFLEDDDVVKITDFGVVRLAGSSLTQTHAIIGTLDYVPPEVWNGFQASQQSDLYTLGLTMYELLTGKLPFIAKSPPELMKLHLTVLPVPLRKIRTDIPVWGEKVIEKLLAKSLEERPESADEVLEIMDKFSRGADEDDDSRSSGSQSVAPSTSRRTLRTETVNHEMRDQLAAQVTKSGKHKKGDLSPPKVSPPSASQINVKSAAFTSAKSLKSVSLEPVDWAKPASKGSSSRNAQAIPTLGGDFVLPDSSKGVRLRTVVLALALLGMLSLLAFPRASLWMNGDEGEVNVVVVAPNLEPPKSQESPKAPDQPAKPAGKKSGPSESKS